MMRVFLPLFVIALASLPSVAIAQATPEREAELLSLHNAISPQVSQIVNQKVVPVFSNLASDQGNPIDRQDIQTLISAIDLAGTIQTELSSSPTFAPAEPEPKYHSVYRWVPVRGRFGKCRYRCVAVCEPVLQSSHEYAAAPGFRQPLNEAIDKMKLYFEDRLGGKAGTAQEDRAAALQTLSILQIVNPAFKPGEVVQ